MISKVEQLHVKHVPQRTCVICRQVQAKGDLVRLVRTGDGAVELDPTGKRRGRGAYLCRRGECWRELSKSNRLEHALRIKVSPESRERLIQCAREFFSQ